MSSALLSVLALSLLSGSVLSTNLFVSHYSGTVYSLDLSGSDGNYALNQSFALTGCGSMPSWLTWEPKNKTVYCTDENFYSSTASLSALSAAEDGQLTQLAKTNTISGGVANVLYGGSDGTGFIAIAHYQASSLSTFKLPLTSTSTAQQTFKYTMSQPGPNPSRQDAPHPHFVVVDPTGKYLMAVDLGADLFRIYSIDQPSGELTSCRNISAPPGSGPRHAAFWTPPASSSSSRSSRSCQQEQSTKVYIANELGNTVSAYTVSYADGCPSFTLDQVLTPYANNASAPQGTKVGEIHITGNFVYASNRNDKTFSGNDSITQYSISSTGNITFEQTTSSYGTYPRTFVINKAGDLVAIGDQTTSNLAIVQRDTTTGKLGTKVADMRLGPTGHPEAEDGLSSVVWAE